MIIIIDYGSQYTKLIAKIIRKLNVYCKIVAPDTAFPLDGVVGIILSGGPSEIRKSDLKPLDRVAHLPTLGICYGAQLLAQKHGLAVTNTSNREYGRTAVQLTKNPLFANIPSSVDVWMSHSNSITRAASPAETPEIIATSGAAKAICGFAVNHQSYGVLFHPEVTHTTHGETILRNFVFGVCGAEASWNTTHIIPAIVARIKEQVGDNHVVMAVSGGVDSTVAASLIHRAIRDKLLCVFVDNGLLRQDEYENILECYKSHLGFNVHGLRESDRFLERLANVSDPEAKRKIIGGTFIDCFESYIAGLDTPIAYLGQGTIYSDVIESCGDSDRSHKIKSHHNVGGLPEHMKLRLVEPLRDLFKDEVRQIGAELAIPDIIINKHPFPGPGLAIRVMGAVTREKLAILRAADHLFISELKQHGLYEEIWQAGVVLLSTKTVGVMGDERTYEYVLALRAVCSTEGMTANCYPFDVKFLENTATKLINNIVGVNRVVYDVSSKPPATIEWE
jgi:GMP synthase (glutamine-hydrolysing)